MHQKLYETLSKYSKIILVGGGTGGHIQPILNIIEELKDTKSLLWIGGENSNESIVAGENNIPFSSISTLKLTTTKSPKILLYPFILLQGIREGRRILRSVMSTQGDILLDNGQDFSQGSKGQEGKICIFSKGGPGSVAVGIAAWTLGIPLYIHESDTIPGRSNRILGKIATKIFLGFKIAKKYFDPEKCEIIGQILHRVFYMESTSIQGNISWKTQKKHILVICGSQGSRAIFNTIAREGKDIHAEWIIALGRLNAGINKDFRKFDNIQLFDWISQEDIASLLTKTHIAITRGSATTLAEIDIFGVKKIIVPLPYSNGNHQYWNAKEYEKNGDILLEQKNLDQLPEIITQLGQNSIHSDI